MRLVIISDTHTRQFELPSGDVLIHCGDHTFHGNAHESWKSLNWLSNAGEFKHRLIIAGNHEVGWEDKRNRDALMARFPKLTYLHNSGIEIDEVKFWGSPYQPFFYDWAFQKQRGEELKENWDQIPEGTDVLITHGPPKGFGDMNVRDERFGDEDLLNRVLQVKPKIHCYGHAHAGYGEYFFEGIHFINAASLDEQYRIANKPIEVNLE